MSGQLGDARLALDALRGRFELPPALLQAAIRRLEAPSPRIALGLALRGLASAAMDLSDGLVGDLQHLLKASQVGATLHTAAALSLLAARTHVDWPRAGISDDAYCSVIPIDPWEVRQSSLWICLEVDDGLIEIK